MSDPQVVGRCVPLTQMPSNRDLIGGIVANSYGLLGDAAPAPVTAPLMPVANYGGSLEDGVKSEIISMLHQKFPALRHLANFSTLSDENKKQLFDILPSVKDYLTAEISKASVNRQVAERDKEACLARIQDKLGVSEEELGAMEAKLSLQLSDSVSKLGSALRI